MLLLNSPPSFGGSVPNLTRIRSLLCKELSPTATVVVCSILVVPSLSLFVTRHLQKANIPFSWLSNVATGKFTHRCGKDETLTRALVRGLHVPKQTTLKYSNPELTLCKC